MLYPTPKLPYGTALLLSSVALYWLLRLLPQCFDVRSRKRKIANLVTAPIGCALVWVGYLVVMHMPAHVYGPIPHRPPPLNRLDALIFEHNLRVPDDEQVDLIDPPKEPQQPPFSFSKVPFKRYYPSPQYITTVSASVPKPRFETQASREFYFGIELPFVVSITFGFVLHFCWPFASHIRETFPQYRIRVYAWFTLISIAAVNLVLLQCEADRNALILFTLAVGCTVGACRTILDGDFIRTNFRLVEHLAALGGTLLTGLFSYIAGIWFPEGAMVTLIMAGAIIGHFALPHVLSSEAHIRFHFFLGFIHGALKYSPVVLLAALLLSSWMRSVPKQEITNPVDNWFHSQSHEGPDALNESGQNE